MSTLAKLTFVELKLYTRDLMTVLTGLFLPVVLLAVLGSIPALRKSDKTFGGMSFIESWLPSLIVLSMVMLAINAMPTYLATYREKGILRRLSTTPVHPSRLLVAQLLVNSAIAVVSVLLLIIVGNLAFGISLPQNPVGFVAAFVLGLASLLSLGLLVASVAGSSRAATGMSAGVYLLVAFFGGVFLPRYLLPDALVSIGNYLPPGVRAMEQAWAGTAPSLVYLAIMAGITVAATAVAARVFRWE